MKILFVWPGVRISIWDVGTGYRKAFSQLLGEENVFDYFLDRRFAYHHHAVPPERKTDVALLSKMATEGVLAEALYCNADAVFIVSGLNFHSAGLWLLERSKIPTVVLLTESPYEDEHQIEWASSAPSLRVLTNDFYSAQQYDWTYIAHAYDPDVHFSIPSPQLVDVLFIGTGWPERQAFFERVDWTGINLKLLGIWPTMTAKSPLWRFSEHAQVKNEDVAMLYSSAKICLNLHRESRTALSAGPRTYEIAACGAFQLSDYRQDLVSTFGSSIPIFHHPQDLEKHVRYYLGHSVERNRLAGEAKLAVADHTFTARAGGVLQVLKSISQKET